MSRRINGNTDMLVKGYFSFEPNSIDMQHTIVIYLCYRCFFFRTVLFTSFIVIDKSEYIDPEVYRSENIGNVRNALYLKLTTLCIRYVPRLILKRYHFGRLVTYVNQTIYLNVKDSL